MKTTIELSDVLLESAKNHARRNNSTLRALIEAGLSRILTEHALAVAKPYVVPDLSVGGGQMLINPAHWRELESEALLESCLGKTFKPDESLSANRHFESAAK